MSAPKHTPGPWKHSAQGHVLTNDAGKFVVSCNDVSAADGRLIAAAPELLEALHECLTASHAHHPEPDEAKCSKPSCVRARAAIAKATGGES